MSLKIINKLLNAAAAFTFAAAITTVNSTCCFFVYEEKAPSEALELVKKHE